MSQDDCQRVNISNKIGKMSCLRYLRLKGDMIVGELPNSIVKLKHLETVDIKMSRVGLPCGVWESKQLRHLRYTGYLQAYNGCFSISPFCRNMYSLPPNNLQTLMFMHDKFFEPGLLHRLINLRKLSITFVSDSTIKILSTLSPVPIALEVLILTFSMDNHEQIKLSSYPNIVKLYLQYCPIPLNRETFPPNLVKLTLDSLMVEGHVVAVLKKLPKLRILKMVFCSHMEEKMDLSGDSDSFPQLEVLHIHIPIRLREVTCTVDISIPKLKKLLLTSADSPIMLSECLAKLRI